MNSITHVYDVVIVGSGPGGASVARELSQNGKKVVILEWGDHDPVRGTFLQAFPQLFMPGKSLFVTGQLLGMVRGITTGGSSLFYCASGSNLRRRYRISFDP
jgi:choline dehydrogenase-like flavoprotein